MMIQKVAIIKYIFIYVNKLIVIPPFSLLSVKSSLSIEKKKILNV